MTAALTVNTIDLHYGAAQALKGISITCQPGRITAVLGRNGVGKSSTLRAVTGINHISSGDITFGDAVLKKSPPYKRARMGIGYVPQGREIFPLLTVKENLETGFACLPKSEHHIPDHIFELFPVLKSMISRRGGDLSGGQQQQLAIARALITRPKLLVLDEPTEGIQPNIITQIGEVIKLLRDQGEMAIVLVEQYFDFAYGLADRFVVLRRGEVVLAGKKGEVAREVLLEGVSV